MFGPEHSILNADDLLQLLLRLLMTSLRRDRLCKFVASVEDVYVLCSQHPYLCIQHVTQLLLCFLSSAKFRQDASTVGTRLQRVGVLRAKDSQASLDQFAVHAFRLNEAPLIGKLQAEIVVGHQGVGMLRAQDPASRAQ